MFKIMKKIHDFFNNKLKFLFIYKNLIYVISINLITSYKARD